MLHCMDGEYKVVNTLTRKVIIYSWLIRNNCQETSISLRTVINSNSLIVDSPKTYVPSACNFIFYPIFFLSIFLPHATKMRLFFSINHVKTSTRKVITYLPCVFVLHYKYLCGVGKQPRRWAWRYIIPWIYLRLSGKHSSHVKSICVAIKRPRLHR